MDSVSIGAVAVVAAKIQAVETPTTSCCKNCRRHGSGDRFLISTALKSPKALLRNIAANNTEAEISARTARQRMYDSGLKFRRPARGPKQISAICHTAAAVKIFFDNERLEVLPWPGDSPA